MKKLFLCSVMLLLSCTTFSQSKKTIKGTVKDLATGKGIANVLVTVLSSNEGVTTNDHGEYVITLSANDNVLQFKASGYSGVSKKLKENTKTLHVSLEEGFTKLNEVVVQSHNNERLGVQTVSKIALKLRPINNAQDLLKTVPGLFIAQHAGGGKAEQIFLRGFDNDHGTDFAVFVDDIPVNLSSHAHGQGYADLHFLIPETVGGADFYKGPHETTLGNFAVSGAALYHTKSRLTNNLVKLEYGQYDAVRALGMFNILDNKHFLTKNYENAYIAIEGTYNKSFFDSPQNLRKLNTFSKYTVNPNINNTLVVSLSTFHSEWNASGQIPLRAVQSGLINWFGAIDDTEGGDTERVHVNVQLQSKVSEQLSLTNQLFYLSNQYNLFSNFTFNLNDPVNGDMIHQFEDRNTFAYKGKLTYNTDLIGLESSTSFGLDIMHNDNKIGLNNSVQRTLLSQVNLFKVKETNYSLYLKERLKISPSFIVLAGLRGDFYNFDLEEIIPIEEKGDNIAFRLSPKLSLFYNITPKVQLYAKASSGFHSNYAQAAVKTPSIDPLPKAVGYDLGSEFKIGHTLIANLAAWYLKSDAEFLFVPDSFEFENKGRSERIGADASFRYQPLPYLWFDTDLNYSYGTLLDEPKEANKIPSAPRFTSTGGATLKFKNGFNGALRYRFMAERPLTEDESVTADDYFLTDIVFNYTQSKYEIGLSVENLFDAEWMEAVFYDSSQLQAELNPVDDFHFTPGTPFLAKLSISYYF